MSEIDRSTQARGQRRALEQVVVAHVLANSAGGYQLIFHRHAHEQPVGASLLASFLRAREQARSYSQGFCQKLIEALRRAVSGAPWNR